MIGSANGSTHALRNTDLRAVFAINPQFPKGGAILPSSRRLLWRWGDYCHAYPADSKATDTACHIEDVLATFEGSALFERVGPNPFNSRHSAPLIQKMPIF